MNFKKFFMTLACMVLVVAATLGFAGCAKDVSAEDVKTYIQEAEVDGVFNQGFKTVSKIKGINGEVVEQVAEFLFDEDGNVTAVHCKAVEVGGEVWLVDGILYVNNGQTKRKYDFATSTNITSIKNILKNLQEDTLEFDSQELMEMLNEYTGEEYDGSGVKVKFQREGSGKNTTFTMKVAGEILGKKIEVTGKLIFKNNKLTKYELNTKTNGVIGIDASCEVFNGTIKAPADAGSYVDA